MSTTVKLIKYSDNLKNNKFSVLNLLYNRKNMFLTVILFHRIHFKIFLVYYSKKRYNVTKSHKKNVESCKVIIEE